MKPARDTISDRIAAALTEKIVLGELLPEEKLRQDDIARQFGTSHVPVREALLRLLARGLATNESRRGVRVAPMNRSDMREIIDMRVALEVMALRRAVANMTAAHLVVADQARLACDAASDRLEWERQNRAFHFALVAPSAMPRLLAEIETLQLLSARHFHANWRADWESRTDLDHRNILAALTRKDPEAAAAILARHLERLR